MAAAPQSIVETYMKAWQSNDFRTMRSSLADDLDFVGPIDSFNSADEHQKAIQGLSQMKEDVVIHKLWADGADVMVWYDLHTKIAPPAPVAEWYHVENGKVTQIRVVFDARPFSLAAS